MEKRRYRDDFPDLAVGFDINTLERDAHPVCALSRELRFIYFNPAWLAFAAANGGEPAISEDFGLDTPLEAALPKILRDFYVTAYREVLETGEPWHHDYECSSPALFRLYHQTTYPFHNRRGLLVVNSLCEERPHIPEYRPPYPPDGARYRSRRTGLITQCCNCRRVQRAAEPERWDWVPAWVKTIPPETTSGLCHICYEYYWKYRPA